MGFKAEGNPPREGSKWMRQMKPGERPAARIPVDEDLGYLVVEVEDVHLIGGFQLRRESDQFPNNRARIRLVNSSRPAILHFHC